MEEGSKSFAFAQLLLKRKRDIETTYAADLTELESYCGFDLIPTDVLILVLSLVRRKDIYAVSRVCKAWNKVVQGQSFFWKGFVRERIDELLDSKNVLVRTRVFDSLMREYKFMQFGVTFRHRFEWLFHRFSWVEFLEYENTENEFCIMCKRHDNTTVEYGYLADGILHAVQIYDYMNDWKTENDKKETMLFYSQGNLVKHVFGSRFDNKITPQVYFCHWNWGTYSGQGFFKEKTNSTIAHGDGRWELKDGRVIEGKGVAWMGKPRMPVEIIKNV